MVSLNSSINGFSYNGFLDGDGDGIRTGGDYALLPVGRNLPMKLPTGIPQDIQYLGKGTSISGTNTVITAAGKTGTDITPDYSTDDPVWSNGYEGAWHLDQISSGITNDSSPNGIHLTVNGGATTTVGKRVLLYLSMAPMTNWRPYGYKNIQWIKQSSGAAARSMRRNQRGGRANVGKNGRRIGHLPSMPRFLDDLTFYINGF